MSGSNVRVLPGSGVGTVPVASDDVPWSSDADARVQIVKMMLGGDNVNNGLLDGVGGAANVRMVGVGTAIQSRAVTVGTVAIALASPALANRVAMLIRNQGPNTIYLGASGVTVANGFPVEPGESLPLDEGPGVTVYAIAAAGSNDVRVLEGS